MLCNLSKNNLQTCIDVGITIKCFVDAGEHTEADCDENNIYFLGYTDQRKLKLF